MFLDKEWNAKELQPLLTFENGRQATPENWADRRKELLNILQTHIYGFTPPPCKVTAEQLQVPGAYRANWAGKLIQEYWQVNVETSNGVFAFPFHFMRPKHVEKSPVFLHINFRADMPDRYTPAEEIIDNGFAVVQVCYKDIVPDSLNGDYTAGLAGFFHKDGPRTMSEWGKIGIWAWAASRVMDVLQTFDCIEKEHIIVCGHSRLGKTALWCGAQDERFWGAYSNDSGFGGAAVAKYGTGERVADFIRCGSWDWFCEQFKTYVGKEDELPYDQHMLLALLAPRHLYVASAAADSSADPRAEFLTCYGAGKVWEMLGETGLVTPDAYPQVTGALPEDSVALHGGKVGYHIRPGEHFFSRTDWQLAMKWMKECIAREKEE